MPLQIHDTLSREKRAFVPADPERVTMYVCGPTVYNYAHLGNMRPPVVFDVLFRLLRATYGEGAVVYARNVTDVDDKIIAAAREVGEPIETITRKFECIYEEDTAALGCLPPTLSPRATDHVPAMLSVVERLVARGHAYAAEGHVLFDVGSFAEYGRLSGRSVEDMIAGARVEVAPYKRNPADFVLWKPAAEGEPGWDSAYGRGRPGWHLECSAMIEAGLGLPVDIHGGGHDLIFPHHENEIAQSRCAEGREDLARDWMHNGFLTMGPEKMSKSLGNVTLAHDLLQRWPGEVIRYALLSAHYRAPLDWTDALLSQAKTSLDRLYQVLRDTKGAPSAADKSRTERALQSTRRALDDDLNTPDALASLFQLGTMVRNAWAHQRTSALTDEPLLGDVRDALLAAGALLGLLQQDPDAWFEGGADDELKTRVEALIAERLAAREAKDFAAADRLRAELDSLGVIVMDNPTGATWRLREPA